MGRWGRHTAHMEKHPRLKGDHYGHHKMLAQTSGSSSVFRGAVMCASHLSTIIPGCLREGRSDASLGHHHGDFSGRQGCHHIFTGGPVDVGGKDMLPE